MQLISLAIFFLGGANGIPAADGATGSFQAQLEEVVDNCEGKGLALSNGPLKITEVSAGVEIELAKLPTLKGSFGSRGKLKAEGEIRKEKLTAKLSLSGRMKPDGLRGVLVAEHYKGEDPVCTQSWSIHAKQ